MVELIIEGIKAALSEDISADITYSLADIRTPDKRQVNYSKTLTLEGTAINNYIFGYIFDIDVENPDFNPAFPNVGVNYSPKKLAKAQLIADGVQIFDGTLRLWTITQNNGVIYYEISLYGKLFDLFGLIGDKKLTDLDFSDLNHAYSWENIKKTWDSGFLGGFRYPLIDYGANLLSPNGQPNTLKFGSLVAAIRYIVYLDKIFSSNSATYTLNFSDTSILKEMLVTAPKPEITGKPHYFAGSLTQDLNYLAYDLTGYDPADGYQLSAVYDKIDGNAIDAIFPFEASNPDPRVKYSYLQFTAPVSTSFQVIVDVSAVHAYNPALTSGTLLVGVRKMKAINVSYSLIGSYAMQLTAGGTRQVCTIEVPKTDFEVNDQLFITFDIPDTHKITVYGGTSSIRAVSPNDLNIYPLVSGDIYDMNNSVPTDIKQVDFLKDFIRLFNLFVTQDPNDPSRFIFTPQIDFYSRDKTKAFNWTRKVDHAEEIVFTPLSQLTAKEYTLTWKADKDYWNERYTSDNKEVYGQVTYLTDTDIINNKEKIEFIFSPAVMVRFKASDIICPAIYKVEIVNGVQQKKTDKFNARLLIWGGVFPAGHEISLLNPNGTISEKVTNYPYAGHLDNPITPTFDLNFGNTNTDLPRASVNQFSRYWGKGLREANHKDGKLVSCKMLLVPEDIESLDFAGLYRVDDQYFRLNLISGYNPFALMTSKVELIKVINL